MGRELAGGHAHTAARLNLQFTEIRAPIDGHAGRALVTAGNLAQADATLLTTVVSIDPVHVYFDTDDIDKTIAKARELGGKADNKQPIPHVGWFSRCVDTEGNEFSLFQSDESVAPPS